MNTTAARPRTAPSLPPRYRLAVLWRVLAAGPGGYAAAAACAAFLARALPSLGMPRPEAVLASTLLAFVVHAVIALWVFATARPNRAWAWIAGSTALLLALAWAIGPPAPGAAASAGPDTGVPR